MLVGARVRDLVMSAWVRGFRLVGEVWSRRRIHFVSSRSSHRSGGGDGFRVRLRVAVSRSDGMRLCSSK